MTTETYSPRPWKIQVVDMTDRSPDLAFRIPGIPPRRTLQSGRGAYRDETGKVRFFTKAPVRADAWQMLDKFRKLLPAGWEPRGDSARVRIELVYPLTREERRRMEAAGANILLPHTVKPDVDNLVKSILDSMTRAGVWIDDAQVQDLQARKWRGLLPRWAVFVWWLPPVAIPRPPRRKAEPEGQGTLFG